MTVPVAMPLEQRRIRNAGPLTSTWRIEQQIIALLEGGLPGYLDDAARQDGSPVRVERPGSYTRSAALEEFPDRALPRIVVIAEGTVGDPTVASDGTIAASWQITLAAVTYATGNGDLESAAHRMAGIYGAAFRGVCLQLAPVVLDEQLRSVRWTRELAPRLPGAMQTQRRHLAVTQQQFVFQIDEVVDENAGPLEFTPGTGPAPIDMGDQPLIEQVGLNVTATTDPLGNES